MLNRNPAARDPRTPVRVLQFVDAFGIGGTERHVMNLGKALDPVRFQLHLACLRRWGPFMEEAEALGAPIAEYPLTRLYNPRALRQQWRFGRDLRRARVEIVHSYNFYTNVFAIPAARLAGVRGVVASIRDTGAYMTDPKRRLLRLVCRLADRVVVNAHAIRSWLLEQGYRRDRVRVIPNGIDTARFDGPHAGERVRHDLDIPADAPLVMVLTRLHERKGLEDLLEAAPRILRRFPAVHFLIVGGRIAVRDGAVVSDDAYRAALEERGRALGVGERLRFAGFRTDIPDILAASTVSVLPSLSEGLSNTVLESMAAGVPVVATAVGGIPEAIEPGVSGLLVPPRDPGALADAISSVLGDPERARVMGRSGRRRIEGHFSLGAMARRTEALYGELL